MRVFRAIKWGEAMDPNRIKNLAYGVRAALRAEASARLDAVLAAGSKERLEHDSHVVRLERSVAEHGRDAVVDRAAYTWFNRLCALRFMDANGYTPTPVVTPRAGSTQPAVLADAARGSFDPYYEISADARSRIVGLLLGSAPSANPSEDAYGELLAAVCSRYAGPMPYLFSEDAASSLLMPRGLLAQGSVLSRIVDEMDEETCSSAEVLGWLYQFYISERKDEYFASGRKATAEDIAPATQLFTPEWIVRFLAENSLGRLWMLNNPDSDLASSMEYFIAPEGDEPHIDIASASDIRVLDPACGSGHILVYAFDLLYRMYEEEGWLPEDIPAMILRNNLAGLEIDRRAAEIASFALEMKALERDPGFFDKDIDADVRVLEPVKLTPEELLRVPQLAERRELLEAMAHMDEVGSLYVPDAMDAPALDDEIARIGDTGDLLAPYLPGKLRVMRANVEALSRTYHVVVANPPYMGSGNMNNWLLGWVKQCYKREKRDLCTCFMGRALKFVLDKGHASLVTMHAWMFLSSYESMRVELLTSSSILLLGHLGTKAFPSLGGEIVSTCAFVIQRGLHGLPGTFIRLTEESNYDKKQQKLKAAIKGDEIGDTFVASADLFSSINGTPIAYWATQALVDSFVHGDRLMNIANPRQGSATGDNARFTRMWWEISRRDFIENACTRDAVVSLHKKWVPFNKGGEFRKWYGNNDCVIAFDDENYKALLSLGNHLPSRDFYFKPMITWSKIASGSMSVRYKPQGQVFADAGMSIFANDTDLSYLQGFLNSEVTTAIAKVLSPTLHFESGQVANYPVLFAHTDKVRLLVNSCRDYSRVDWDSFETSWDFTTHPLARTSSLADAYALWESECRERFDQLKSNEEELNRIFARIYRMEGEVPIEVPDDKVSVRLADRARDARSLVSYGVGCMLGRYSTYEPGLILADQGQTLSDFEGRVPGAAFLPDADNVLPVLDQEWFGDDAVAGLRSWLAGTYGEATLDENVAWLEESIGKDLRSYLCRDFYADHVRTYQKRPIYWMFQSPNGAFRCLVYMHRYEPGTVGTILTGYLRPLEDKLRARVQVLSGSGGARDVREADRLRAQLAELEAWERDVVYPLAHERVSIDLDDGVKVNYNRFPHALAKVTGLSEWR